MTGYARAFDTGDFIAQLDRRVRALETQPNQRWQSPAGQQIMSLGLIDPTETPSRYGQVLYGPTGVPILTLGQLPGGQYGALVEDTGGNPRVQLGELSSGDYGLEYWSPDGSHAELFPPVSTYYSTAVSTSSTSYVDLSVPPLTAYLGASGDALLTISAYVGIPASCTALVGVSIDGTTPQDYVTLSTSGGSVGAAADVSSTRRISQWYGALSGNADHTFKLEFKSSNGTATFGALSLVVQPL